MPNTAGITGQVYSYALSASDVDGDSLTITAPTKPAWLNFTDNGDGTASLSGTPGSSDVGPNAVTLRVSDGTTSIDQPFSITVTATVRVITMGILSGSTWAITPSPTNGTPTDNGNGGEAFDPVDANVDHSLSAVPNGNG